MSRVINTDSPGKQRSQCRRTIAEILRHLMLKRQLDEEAKDMAAALVYALRGIAASVETTAAAWEKRDYYLKADRFRLEWDWVDPATDRLTELVLKGQWARLPQELAALAPRFADVHIAKLTRSPTTWKSSYQLLLQER
jgi:hypothetical protein